MRPRDTGLAAQLDAGLSAFAREIHALPGIAADPTRSSLIEQLLESVHRVSYIAVISKREISPGRGDPNSGLFDPLRAAILQQRAGNIDEAFWLVFLFTHFGKNRRGGWRYAREVYGRLGDGQRWDWPSASASPRGFRKWLHDHKDELERPGVPGGFGNHRKYESLDADSAAGTGAVVESYVDWVKPPRTHPELMRWALQGGGGDPQKAFQVLYDSMSGVARFGRTGRFDFLAMIGKLHLAPIAPGFAYLNGATGPLKGARLLFGEQSSAAELDKLLGKVDEHLHVGMQVLEDALCNWQKSPGKFVRFRG